MSNIPELLGLHHSNPLGLHPIAVPIFLFVMAVTLRILTQRVYKKERRGLYPLLYSLWWATVAATYYYCFMGDLPLFSDTDLGRSEVCVGWFCQRQVVGVGWSLLGVAMLSYTTYSMLNVLLHVIAHQSDRMGLGEKQWREWSWIVAAMLLGASVAGIADDFVPITGIWIMIGYHVIIILMTLVKLVADTVRSGHFGRCLLSAVCFLVVFEAVTMLAIECIEGYIYLFIPIVGLFVSADYRYNKKARGGEGTHRAKGMLLIAFLFTTGLLASCSKDEVAEEPHDLPVGEAQVTGTTHSAGMTAYNFVYPSIDPAGQPVMLSGTITMGDEVQPGENASGLVLYNHFTIYRADQCPSRGELSMQRQALGDGLITVSPDYYGFGATEHHHQAYCLSLYNARTSIDALLAAKQLLSGMGYSWNNILFNVGYSQGGQTSMAVVRLVAEHYPDIDITYPFAGAGSYDLPETYRQFLSRTIAGMPSTVISVVLAYNEFKNLGIPREEMFLEPVLSHIDDWILSKRYTRQEIDDMVGTLAISEYITPSMLDTTAAISRRLMQALDSDNLCQGWTPRGDEHIMLFHSTQDITVPVANTQRMYDFLTSHGVQDVDLQIHDIAATATTPAHEGAALTFGLLAFRKVREILSNAQ